MKMKIKYINNKKTWEDFVLNHPQVNFLQSFAWGEFHRQLGKQIFRYGFYEKNRLIGVALLIKEKARRGTYLTCPGGPLLDAEANIWLEFVKLIKKISHQEKALFIRVRPQFLDKIKWRLMFSQSGFINAPMHMHAETTWQLDLNQSQEEIFKNMRKNTRSAIKKSLKNQLKIKITKDIKAIDRLYDLQIKTAQRHGFVPFSKKFLKTQFKSFSVNNQAKIIEVYQKKDLVCSAIFIFYGQEAVYHYSGSAQLAYQTNASYLLLWTAIKEAKKQKLSKFNFWGVVPRYEPKHRFWGVTVFKRGFGGFPINYLHAQDLPIKTRYWLVWLIETTRRVYRHL